MGSITYPTSQNELCYKEERQTSISFNTGSLVSIGAQATPGTYSACSSQVIDVEYKFANNLSGTSAIVPLSYSIQVPSNITLDPINSPVYNSTCPGQLTAPNYTISQTSLTTGDFVGVIPAEYVDVGECFTVSAKISGVGCNIGNLTLPSMTIFYKDICGELNQCTNIPTPISPGPSNCTDCFSINKFPASTPAIIGEPFNWIIEVCSNNAPPSPPATTLTVDINEIYPPNFIPVSPSSNPIKVNNIQPQGCTPITILGAFNDYGGCPDMQNQAKIITTTTNVTAYACVDVICPPLVNYILITDDTEAANFFENYPGTVYGKSIFIADYYSLVFPGSYNIKNCTLLMGSGSQLFVSGGDKLELNNSTISSCPYMWRGIELGIAAEILINRSTIKDAENAVYAPHDAVIEITNSYIHDCVTGVLTGGLTSTFNSYQSTIYGTEFGKSGLILKKEYPAGFDQFGNPINAQPAHGIIGRAGILLNDAVIFTVGDNSANPNLFFNINYGIESHNSSLNVHNSAFRDIYADGAYADWLVNPALKPWGCGVYAKGTDWINFVNVYPLFSGNATIENAPVGIYTNRMNARISRLEMQNVIKGVNSEYSELRSVIVNSCVIHARQRGIDFNENHNANSMVVSENEIYLEPLVNGAKATACIYLRETQPGNDANYNISDNRHLETISGDAGIVALNVANASIGYSAIYTSTGTQFPAWGSIGIAINGGGNNAISCNSVTNTIPHSNISTKGMMVSVSKNNRIECNQFGTGQSNIGPFTGMWFGGDCDVSNNISGNSMRDCVTGLYLNSASRIGSQVHRGNVWQNPQIGNVTSATNANTLNNNFIFSRITFNPTSGVIYSPNSTSPPLWFVPDLVGTTFSGCGTQTCIAAIAGGGGGDVEQLRMVARDSVISFDYRDETRNQAQSNLYALLNEDSLLLVSDSTFQLFYINKKSLAIGQLQEVNEDLRNAEVYTAEQLATIQLADSLIRLKTDSLNVLDSLHRISPVSGYEATRQNIIDRINILNNTVASIHQQHDVSSDILRDAAQLKNNPIVPVELPESNHKVMNELLMQYKDNGQSSVADNYNALLAIAQQCPFAGGPAVYQARAMLELVDQNVNYNDDAVCLQSGIYRIMQEDVSGAPELFDFKLIPNPASQQVTVDLKFANDEAVNFEIRNVLGGIIKEFVIDKGLKSIVFSINNFGQGIYFVRVRKEGVTLNAKRLVIIK